jgi:tetratricopeptide (TPR) repeat protein
MSDGQRDSDRAPTGASTDFFISRRGTSAAVAREVAGVLMEAGYSVLLQDFDAAPGTNFVALIHNALKTCRHMVLLLTKDYDASDFTVMEMTNFLAAAARERVERRLVVLRIEECNPDGILAGIVFSDLVGIDNPHERRERILAAAEGRIAAGRQRAKIFENVPPRDLNFTGRDMRLAELHRMLHDCDQPTAITQAAIFGLGGIGKTSLAVEYAHRYGGSYAGVWWAPAEQRTLLVASLASLAARLEPRLAEEANQENSARAALARLGRFTLPFLLIYDNVETPETLRDLLPSAGARVLLTTRWADWGGQAAEIKLDVLDEQAAAAFLQKRAGRADDAGAARLSAALGGLPVALDHAGAYCRLTATSFDAYREKIDVRISRAPKGASYPASVAASFGLAIEKAAVEQPAAERLLAFFAFLAPERIPLDLLADEVAPEEDRAEALGELGAVSLIEHDPFDDGTPAVTLHRLVQAAMRARVAGRGQTAATVDLATRALAAAFPPNARGDPSLWPRCARLLPHVLALHELLSSDAPSAAARGDLLGRVGGYLLGRAAYREAEPLLHEAIAIGETMLGREHPVVGVRLNNLALLYWTTGRYAEAEPCYREAIAIGDSTVGRRHADVAARLNNLARLLNDTGRRAEAEPLFREAIAIGESTLGRAHPEVAVWLNNLAILLNESGRNDEAEPLYREAIAIGERHHGRDNVEVGRCINNLARLLRDTERFAEAEALAREAVALGRRVVGDDHPLIGRFQENLAQILLRTGDRGEALAEAEMALAAHEKTLGIAHPWSRESARTCAQALDALGRCAEAAALRDRYGMTPPT